MDSPFGKWRVSFARPLFSKRELTCSSIVLYIVLEIYSQFSKKIVLSVLLFFSNSELHIKMIFLKNTAWNPNFSKLRTNVSLSQWSVFEGKRSLNKEYLYFCCLGFLLFIIILIILILCTFVM